MEEKPASINPLRNPALVALFTVTAALFLYMAFVTGPAFRDAAGVALPDGRFGGYTPADVLDMHAGAKANPQAAEIANHMYRTLDFAFPAVLALSLTMLAATGFAALRQLGSSISVPLARIASGAIAVPYLVIDLRENGLAQALFSQASLASDVPPGFTALLPAFTAWKFATLGAAALIVIAIWARVWLRARRERV